MLLARTLDWAPVASRVAGFLVAAATSWQLNRRLTFRSTTGVGSLFPYGLAATIGAAVNFGVFILWLMMTSGATIDIVIGVALGALVALGFNFTVSRSLIFSSR